MGDRMTITMVRPTDDVERVIELSRFHDPARGPFEPLCDRGQQRRINERPSPDSDEWEAYDERRFAQRVTSTLGSHPLDDALNERYEAHKRTFSRDSRYERGGFPDPGSLNRKRTGKNARRSS